MSSLLFAHFSNGKMSFTSSAGCATNEVGRGFRQHNTSDIFEIVHQKVQFSFIAHCILIAFTSLAAAISVWNQNSNK